MIARMSELVKGDIVSASYIRTCTVVIAPEPADDGYVRIGLKDHISGGLFHAPVPAWHEVLVHNPSRRGRDRKRQQST